MAVKKGHKGGFKRAGRRAGRPNYSLQWRKYPYWMPDTPKGGPSQPIIDIWHMKRVILWTLGHISIDGKRNDRHLTFTADQIAKYHKLLDMCDEKLKEGEQKYLEEQKKIGQGILKDVFDQTEQFINQRKSKQCLKLEQNLNKGDNKMAKMSFAEMMEWSKKQKDFESAFNFLKFPQGIHLVRVITDPEESYFRAYTQHDCGQEKEFRCWLCWDYIMDNKEVREYFDSKEMLTQKDVELAKKYGDPVCNTLEVIKKYVKDMEPVYKALRTKTRCVMNMFYIHQAFPDQKTDKTPSPGLYVLEQSAAFNKLIINAMNKESATDMEGVDEDELSLLSAENGKVLAIQVEGEGIGKNRRTYTIDFKGQRGPLVYCEDGGNPYHKSNRDSRLTLPEDFQINNLMEVEALRFLPYQEVINQIKSIKTIKAVIDQLGYEIPGDEPSDNPLDDNYDKSFAQKTVGKPIAMKQIKEDSPLSKVQKPKKEAWEDEDDIAKDKRAVQSKKVVEVEEDEVIEDDDFDFDIQPSKTANGKKENVFEKAVPKSDPEKEVITNAPKSKRKIF